MEINKTEIVIVVAIDSNRGIGKDGGIPWPRIPADMKRFVEETTPWPVLMGRKTHESLPPKYRPLPNRENFVITRTPEFEAPGCVVAHSLEEAVAIAQTRTTARICIIGGGEIYAQALPIADLLLLTRVEGDFNADVFFPEYKDQFPSVTMSQTLQTKDGLNFTFENRTRS